MQIESQWQRDQLQNADEDPHGYDNPASMLECEWLPATRIKYARGFRALDQLSLTIHATLEMRLTEHRVRMVTIANVARTQWMMPKGKMLQHTS